jgi:hypothetical protein
MLSVDRTNAIRPGGSANPLQAQLTAAVPQRTTYIEPFGPGDLRRGKLPQTTYGSTVQPMLEGTRLDSRSPALKRKGGMLENFRTKNTSAEVPEILPEDEPQCNVVHPEKAVAKPVNSEMGDAIGMYEIAITIRSNSENETPLNCLRTMPHGLPKARNICNLATANYVLYRQQMQEVQTEQGLAEYLRKSPSDYWQYMSVDGIVEAEQMLGGGESSVTNGVHQNALGLYVQDSHGLKLLTLASKGEQFIYNVFGDNIKPGAHLYFVLKKDLIASDFILSQRAGPGGLNSSTRYHIQTYLDGANQEVPLRPYQLCPFCLPKGGPVPSEFTRYWDENGLMRTDGLVIYLGKVLATPYGHQYRNNTAPPTAYVTSPGKQGISQTPYTFTDSRRVLDRDPIDLLRVIWDSDNAMMPL